MSDFRKTRRVNSRKIRIIIAGGGFLLLLFFLFYPRPLETTTLTVNGTVLHVQEAVTPAQHKQGLSGRKELKPDQGMLFIFPKEDYYGFWMTKMRFPIDIMWINKKGKVVDKKLNVQPCVPNHCPTYTPNKPAKYVLETVAGFAKAHNVIVGTQLSVLLHH